MTRTEQEKKAQHTQRQVKDWQASGLTQTEYCQRHKINPSTFRGWIACAREAGAPTKIPNKPKHLAMTIVPVSVQEIPAKEADTAHLSNPTEILTLQHPSGWQLILPVTTAVTWISDLIKTSHATN